jgi:hypothetical protein
VAVAPKPASPARKKMPAKAPVRRKRAA